MSLDGMRSELAYALSEWQNAGAPVSSVVIMLEGFIESVVERRLQTSTLNKFVQAASRADWQQVALNGGPPCFRLEPDPLTGGVMPRFCLRAQRWDGHRDGDYPYHRFVSLADLLAADTRDEHG